MPTRHSPAKPPHTPSSTARTVLVTGGTRGIGAAIVETFIAEGATVIATGTDASQFPRPANAALRYVEADFSRPASLRRFLRFVEQLERLDVCINNAGINIIKRLDEFSEPELDRLLAVDLRAPILIARAAALAMGKHRGGHIVNIGSIWSVVTKQGRVPYVTAKTGVVGLTRALATELAPAGILVNCVSPGFVETELTKRSLTRAEQRKLAAQVPLGRFAQPAEIAYVVAVLAASQNTYITGQNIVVDGGFTHV